MGPRLRDALISRRDALISRRDALISRLVLALAACAVVACGEPPPPPNVLWLVWDTVRADRLGVYGADPDTTPNLDRWAEGARVFDDVLAVGATTVPNHASMFTGLLPSEHGATNPQPRLPDGPPTIAELLRGAGYRTWLWAANPHLNHASRFPRGFERHEHPWDLVHQKRAIALAREKVGEKGDGSGLLGDLGRRGRINSWAVKDSGTLAQGSLLDWIDSLPDAEPWFVFMNYMEAHRPVTPSRRFREQVMTPERVEASFRLDRGWNTSWGYTFGLRELDAEHLAVIEGVYDAAIAELDDLFAQLLAGLEARGELENTVVIVTADHGELLGEHHMLDHQYALYEPVLRVPLVVHFPARFTPGREPRPVMSFDLFPTVLELAGVPEAQRPASRAESLLAPHDSRTRLAEYPAAFGSPLRSLRRLHPDFDGDPWRRRLRALSRDGDKLIWASDGRHELYRVVEDPRETRDLFASEPERAQALQRELDTLVADLEETAVTPGRDTPLPEDDRRRLEALGYGDGDGGVADDATPDVSAARPR